MASSTSASGSPRLCRVRDRRGLSGYARRAVDVRSLYSNFLASLPEPIRDQLARHETAITGFLLAHWSAGLAMWSEIEVAPERFARELARRAGTLTSVDAVLATLESVRGSDVYLAIACCDGDARAIGRLDELVARELRHAATKLHASADQVTEVHADLRRVLLVEDDARRAAMREYAGRGDLRGYLRVMATRALIRAINRGRREIAIDDAEFFDRVLPDSDPEISILRAQYHAPVDAALRAALAHLDTRSRALLRYHLIDGWSIDQVGKLYGVHRATAARWLADARETLGAAIRAELANRLQIDTAEVDSIVRLVQSRVDMSLDRLLVPEVSR
jgi:RNA polymerase sigma-70 factor, ECF subfamily